MNNYRDEVLTAVTMATVAAIGERKALGLSKPRTEWPGFSRWLICVAVRIAKKMTAVMVEKITEFGCWGHHD